ncbi:MAG TPA: hypothetical protein ENJ82_05610, partial [Bacteroidetes bacterium]|nr:hypothetical protein [Bacteroidota bacterium]
MNSSKSHPQQKQRLKTVAFTLLLSMLFLPVVQEWTGVFPSGKLAGVENHQDTIPLRLATWMSGEFQQNFEVRHYGWMGFRNSMVRLRNQLDYSLLGENYRSIMIGEGGELVRRGSMEAMRGLNFIGQDKIDYHASHTALLQRHFAARGVRMLVVITPSKLRCMPEILPEYALFANPDNHYNRYLEAFGQEKVDYLNLTSILKEKIAENRYRIFPRTGTHWTDIGAFYGIEFIAQEMEKRGGKTLPPMRFLRPQASLNMRDTDADAG